MPVTLKPHDSRRPPSNDHAGAASLEHYFSELVAERRVNMRLLGLFGLLGIRSWTASARSSIRSTRSRIAAQASCGGCRRRTVTRRRDKSAHVGPLRDRKKWFEPIEGPILALWWVLEGQIPTVAEALDRLEHLKVHGPTREAFTFRTPFAPPDSASELPALDAEFCEWAT
jgi:Domain of unknown function (DUF3291)